MWQEWPAHKASGISQQPQVSSGIQIHVISAEETRLPHPARARAVQDWQSWGGNGGVGERRGPYDEKGRAAAVLTLWPEGEG